GPAVVAERPDIGEVVGEEIRPRQARDPRPAVDVAADDRAPVGVGVLVERVGDAGRDRVADARRRPRAFLGPPAVVLAAFAGGRLEVQLLDLVLADVGDVEVAGLVVEGVPPRVAQAEGPDLGSGARPARERVAGRDRVVAGRVAGEVVA